MLRVLIANRGEIAIRISRALAGLRIGSVAIHSQDDSDSLHVRRADQAVALPGTGPAAYLDIEAVVAAARMAGCDAIHPGYGFLSESAAFAQSCAQLGLLLIGPGAQALALFGDKVRARQFAQECGVPIVPGLAAAVDLVQARAFRESLGPDAVVILKAVSGGGGRGIRIVRPADSLEQAWERCRSEALGSFGSADVYVEQYLPQARHIEVQIVGDGSDVAHLWERECTLQRQHQKVVEIAPSPGLPPALRQTLLDESLTIARRAAYRSLGTIEFLVWPDPTRPDGLAHAFIEANPRIQVEHTVTEEITGVDLVQAQIRIAAGASLGELGLLQPPAVRGYALQRGVNMERQQADGSVRPSGGRLEVFEPPTGPGVRVDTFGRAGYSTSSRYDSLLAKLIVHGSNDCFADVVDRALRALGEFRIEGVLTNLAWLSALLSRPEVRANVLHTRFADEQAAGLVQAAAALEVAAGRRNDGGANPRDAAAVAEADLDGDQMAVRSPIHGVVVSVAVSEDDFVPAGAPLFVVEAMKMEHVVVAPASGRVGTLRAIAGDTVLLDQILAGLQPEAQAQGSVQVNATGDDGAIRADLQAVLDRRLATRDEARPEAVHKRHERQLRTARENLADLCDAGSFVEFGQLVVAAQRARRTFEDLARSTPADGIVTGLATVNGDLFAPQRARCVVMAYDATVLAGTQGRESHRKCSRMFEMAARLRLPLIFYTEGGGGRPGDTEKPGENTSFTTIARLSGQVPVIGILAGYCFAGNAAMLGCCDVIIATEGANLGMGGPAMVEGGGLGVYSAAEIGPARMHHASGVVDILVRDEAEATAVAKRYLAYFQGPVAPVACADQRLLRTVLPEDRRRAYDVRRVIGLMADEGSMLELRAGFGRAMVTALVRIEGRTLGVLANNPAHLGGAVDSDAADKGARFLQLCDAHHIPVLQLCDTPGIMVGPDAEKTALVRHSARLLMAGANLRVPAFTIILRKAYGIGMVAMMGGALRTPLFNIAWPSGEYGAMGLEGAVRLGYRKELDAIDDPVGRQAFFDERLAALYEDGRALNKSSSFDFDDVIDPAESRAWILAALQASDSTRLADSSQPHAFITPW